MTDVQESFYRLVPHLADIDPDEEGRIEYAGRRFVFFHTEVFAKLFDDMEEAAGEEIRDRIKDFGEDAGKAIAEKMDEDFKDTSTVEVLKLLVQSGFDLESIRSISGTDDVSQLQKIFGYGRYVGWLGEVEMREYDENERAVFGFHNTFESYSYANCRDSEECAEGTNCKFLTGVIQGMLEYFWEDDSLKSYEEACAANPENDVCIMVVEK